MKKEGFTIRRHLGLFILLLIVFPGVLTIGTGMYQQTLPEDIPVAIVPADETTTDDDIAIIRGGAAFFATPITYEDPDTAREALQREQVYVVMEVPGNLTGDGTYAPLTFVSDQHFVPFQDPSNLTVDILDNYLNATLPADIEVNHERLGENRSLSSFLIPTVILIFLAFYGAAYIPYQLFRERQVLDRLRTETRIEAVIGIKLAVHSILLLVPLAVVAVIARRWGYGISAFDAMTLVTVLMTFLLFATFGIATLFALGVRQHALFINVGGVAILLATAGTIYPVGFFSEIEHTIIRSNPVHYSVITLRSSMLRDTSMWLYLDYLGYITGTVLVGSIALIGSIEWFRRRR